LVRTVGVVIGIPEPWRAQLDEQRLASGDPMAPYIPAHLTLLGPVTVEPSAQARAEVEAHLAAVAAAHRPFHVRLAGTGTFRPVTQVVFVTVDEGTEHCVRLAADIRSGPLDRVLAYPYHPHVTVAHDVPPDALDEVYATLADFEASFLVDGFTLYEHGPDGHWHPQRRFDLGVLATHPLTSGDVTASDP
jgi:2'-5' RNA ligase